jgi:hypothetical protein
VISRGTLLLQRDIGNVVAMLQSMGEEKFGNSQMVMVKPNVLHPKPQITSSKSNVLHLSHKSQALNQMSYTLSRKSQALSQMT